MNKSVFIFALLFLLASCGTQSDQRTASLNKYLKEQFKSGINESWRGIVVLSSNGCHTCNTHFLRFMEEQPDFSQFAVLVTAKPGEIKPAVYEDKKAATIWKDYKNRFFHDTELMQASGVIYLKAGAVDTIIDIRSEELEQQIDYIRQRFRSK